MLVEERWQKLKYVRSFADKNVLITGAARGIGSAIAQRLFFKEHASLLLIDKDIVGLQKLKKKMESKRAETEDANPKKSIQVFEVDLTSSSAITALCESIGDTEVDVLVNNAGIVYSGSFQDMDIENFDKVLDTNLRSAIHLTHKLLPKIIDKRGAIVFIASGAGLVASGVANAYSTSKFGLVGFSEALRAELWNRVGVTTICPAFVNTDIMKSSLSNLKNNTQEENKQINKLGGYVRKFGADPDKFAKVVIKSIKKNKGLVTFGIISKSSYITKRFSPALSDYCNFLLYRRLRKEGVIG